MTRLTKNDVKWYGRWIDYDNIRYFDYSASGFEFCFTGTKATAVILSDPERWNDDNKGFVGVYVTELLNPGEYEGDSFWKYQPKELSKRIALLENRNEFVLFESSVPKTVVIKVLKISEAAFGYAGFEKVELEGVLCAAQKTDTSDKKAPVKMEIIGDSITCGYGIEGVFEVDEFKTQQERADKAYGFLTARHLGAEFNEVSWSGIGLVSNYIDAAKETPDINWLMNSLWHYTDKSLSLRLGYEPEVWDSRRFEPDIVIVHLGTNDTSFVRDREDRRLSYVSALRQFLEAIHRRSPKAKICCCLGAMGQELCASMKEAMELFRKEFTNVSVKFVQFPVQDEKDGIGAAWHPSAITHEKMSEQLAKALKDWV